jgi:iron complex outermembrane receptor protein
MMHTSRGKSSSGAELPSSSLIRRSVRDIAAGLGASLISLTAMGQEAAVSAAPELQEIVVTGSMIKRTDAETAEAVTIVTIDSLKNQGITTTEQALQQISAIQQGTAYNVASSVTTLTGGGSFANLRSLGSARTLVLLDGERLANNVTLGNAVDISGIPFAAIDHIEVLREGASSLYGTDAIAGVINFITKKDYDSGEVNLNFSKPQKQGGDGYDGDFTFGKGNLASDGYNVMIAVNYTKQDELTASQRSYATGYYPSQGLTNINYPGNSPGAYQAANSVNGNNIWQVGYPGCTAKSYVAAYPAGSCSFLYSSAVDLIPESDELSGLISFTKALAGNNTLSLQYFWVRSESSTYGGPNEYFFNMYPGEPYFPTAANSTCLTVCTGAPDLTAPITAEWTDPNNSRYSQNINTEQRVLLTFAGNNAGWDYSTSFDWSKNKNEFNITGGYPNLSAYTVINGGNAYLNPLINPFGPQSAAGQALINSGYLNGAIGVGNLSLWSLNGHAGHELGDAFGAGRAAAFAVGFDVRGERIDQDDSLPLTGTLASVTGLAPETTEGSRNIKAAYVELNVPVTHGLDFTVSDREDVYSDFGETNNAKLSFRYQPFSILTFRGAASTGFRAPSLVNLYQPQFIGAAAGDMNGPGCASGNYTVIFSQTNCLSQGLGVFGGNNKLNPETSENFDLGFVVEPIRDLGITVDYYRVLMKNVIQAIPALAIYQNPTEFANLYFLNNAGTLSTATALSVACPNSDLHAPTCGYVAQTPQNTGGITTDGIDINAQYLIRSDFGKFRFGLDSTVVTQYILHTYTGGPGLNLVGQFNQGFQPVIRWQYLLSADWTSNGGRWGAGLQDKFQSRYADEFSDVANVSTDPRQVGVYSIWNGYVSFKPVDPLTVLLGIRNLFDTNPPFSNQTANWQTPYNPQFSDPFGRTFYARLKYTF